METKKIELFIKLSPIQFDSSSNLYSYLHLTVQEYYISFGLFSELEALNTKVEKENETTSSLTNILTEQVHLCNSNIVEEKEVIAQIIPHLIYHLIEPKKFMIKEIS